METKTIIYAPRQYIVTMIIGTFAIILGFNVIYIKNHKKIIKQKNIIATITSTSHQNYETLEELCLQENCIRKNEKCLCNDIKGLIK